MTGSYEYDFDEDVDGFDGEEGEASLDEDDIEEDDYIDDDEEDKLDDNEVAINASLDGQFDAEYNGVPYPSYEMSVDADKMTDEQKELYETEYLAGYQDQENADELED